ncbi:hypothetical protein F2Q69_00050072 [Brassica cretica]|uniref:Uncharacterized protein n=1 Tax=Brassica cretica TaxID=69181 RepID=A0A8S9PUS7_BRACR|nr:hypothetical protein F2Q69_00050072 [Brassica cretica]
MLSPVLYSAAVSQASHGATLSNSGNSHLPRDALMLQSNKRKSPKMMSSLIEKKLEFSSSPETDFILRRRGGEQTSISFKESRHRFDSS